jgi:predicted TPR repeat methyltransferase
MNVRAFFDSIASQYDAIVAKYRYVGPAWLEQALNFVHVPDRAVDFGCGNGILGHVLRSRYPDMHLTGLDISESMVAEAFATGTYDKLFVHDLNHPVPQISDASVQLVVALGFAEYLAEPAAFLAETARVLAPGGKLIISFQEHWPDRESLAPRTLRDGDLVHHAYTVEEVAALLQAQPFSLDCTESLTGYIYPGFACPYVMARGTRQTGQGCIDA